MMKKRFWSVLFALGLAAGAGAIEIARDGRAACVIAVADDASVADRFAAAELGRYLKQMTGGDFPAVALSGAAGPKIVVGQAAGLTGWNGTDEVRIVSADPETLLVAGEGTRGTLYAVYVMLEELGVRFYGPECEVIPSGNFLTLENVDYRYCPRFAYREPHSEMINDDGQMAKWRLNGAMCKRPLPEEMGGCYQMDMAHSLVNAFLKPADHFEAHPEWYAWRADKNERQPTQVCLSNPDALAQLIVEVRRRLAEHPELRFVAIGGADNNEYCQCDDCRVLAERYAAPAAAYLVALNAVAAALRDDYPDTLVMFQAYWGTERPPENLVFEPNVAVTLAMLDRNHGFPASATARHNLYLEHWSRLAGGKIYIWDYWATFGNFLLPMPNLDAIGESMRTYAEYGVKGIFSQLPFGSLADFGDLRNYLFAQLAWNPYRDASKMTDEFCRAFYGPGAPMVLEYIALLEKARDRQPNVWIGVYSEETKHWLKPEDVGRMRQLLDAALAATEKLPAERDRLRKLTAGLLLVECLRYPELAAAGVPLRPREELIEELSALGSEFKCGAYKEWDDFFNLIKRLRETADRPLAAVPRSEVLRVVPEPARLDFRPQDHGYPWMPFDTAAVRYTVPETAAGRWQVAMEIAVDARSLDNPAAAYAGIYAPNECTRVPLAFAAGDAGQRTVDLGEWELPAGSHIWAMPGVIGPIESIAVAAIVLTPAGHGENSAIH